MGRGWQNCPENALCICDRQVFARKHPKATQRGTGLRQRTWRSHSRAAPRRRLGTRCKNREAKTTSGASAADCQRQSKSEPKGSAKCCHFGVARLPVSLRQHPGDRAYHRAGGRPDALAREGQLLTMCVWVKPCLGGPCSGPSDSFRRSSQGCSRGGSGGPAAHRLVVLIRRFRSIRRRAGCW